MGNILEVSTLKNIKRVFTLGMTAPEVVIKIVELHPNITSIILKIYIPTKNLEEESAIETRTSLDRMLFHNDPKLERTISLERKDINLRRFKEITNLLNKEQALTVTSSVKLLDTNYMFHIPMIDFNCEVSPENQEKIQKFLEKIGQRGVILQSGRSYHFYGTKLINDKHWIEFLGKCLLFVNHTDSRYIGHRLIDGYSSSRISESTRRPCLPKVIAIV